MKLEDKIFEIKIDVVRAKVEKHNRGECECEEFEPNLFCYVAIGCKWGYELAEKEMKK